MWRGNINIVWKVKWCFHVGAELLKVSNILSILIISHLYWAASNALESSFQGFFSSIYYKTARHFVLNLRLTGGAGVALYLWFTQKYKTRHPLETWLQKHISELCFTKNIPSIPVLCMNFRQGHLKILKVSVQKIEEIKSRTLCYIMILTKQAWSSSINSSGPYHCHWIPGLWYGLPIWQRCPINAGYNYSLSNITCNSPLLLDRV